MTGSTPEASAISLPPFLLRLLPAGATVAGWVSHPLKTCAFPRRTEKCGLAFHGWIGSVGQEKLLRDFGRAGGSSRVGRIAMRRGALERKFATEPMRIVLEAGTHSG